jgi:hypothetical protein
MSRCEGGVWQPDKKTVVSAATAVAIPTTGDFGIFMRCDRILKSVQFDAKDAVKQGKSPRNMRRADNMSKAAISNFRAGVMSPGYEDCTPLTIVQNDEIFFRGTRRKIAQTLMSVPRFAQLMIW